MERTRETDKYMQEFSQFFGRWIAVLLVLMVLVFFAQQSKAEVNLFAGKNHSIMTYRDQDGVFTQVNQPYKIDLSNITFGAEYLNRTFWNNLDWFISAQYRAGAKGSGTFCSDEAYVKGVGCKKGGEPVFVGGIVIPEADRRWTIDKVKDSAAALQIGLQPTIYFDGVSVYSKVGVSLSYIRNTLTFDNSNYMCAISSCENSSTRKTTLLPIIGAGIRYKKVYGEIGYVFGEGITGVTAGDTHYWVIVGTTL